MKQVKYSIIIIFKLLCFIALHLDAQPYTGPEGGADRPNILLIVADDLGYADLGCYGGDMETPHIDRLAESGIRFSNFHTSPYCAPTRAMLLSGNDNHTAGMGRQSLVTEEYGYEGRLSNRIATIPEVLANAGYHTYMAGKWHLGLDSIANPHNKGFEHSFVILSGAGNHYNDQGVFSSVPTSLYTEDGQPAGWHEGDYSTDFYTDKLIEYIDAGRADGRPFFAFAAYTSPHWPLQVDKKHWEKYKGRYDAGYEVLKASRLASLKAAGLVSQEAVLPPSHPRVIPWEQLSEEEKKKEARKMELYAGMVDNLDQNIGRLINYLKQVGELENTLVVFMSDNGAAAEDFYHDERYGPFIRQHFTEDYDAMGSPRSFICYGPQWAEAGSAPFRYFKGQVTEGGIVAPLIISGPGVAKEKDIVHDLVTVMDLAPTFYDMARTSYPRFDREQEFAPLKGESMAGFLAGSQAMLHDSTHVFALEHASRAMLRKGDWKIVNNAPPFDATQFELFKLTDDLAELNDLSDSLPGKYRELMLEWEQFAEAIRIQFPPPKPTKTK